MKYLIVLFIALFGFTRNNSLVAQVNDIDTTVIEFNALFNNKQLHLDSTIYLNNQNTDSIIFSNFKFYISNIKLLKDNKIVYQETNSYHLINFRHTETTTIKLPLNKSINYDALIFDLGIDSLNNSKGVGSKDLDPLKGMYWAWHSGYINFKLEGQSNFCKTRNNTFEFHLGGFLNEHYALQHIKLTAHKKNNIAVDVALDKFITAVDIKDTNHIMTPGKEAVDLSKIAATMFSINK